MNMGVEMCSITTPATDLHRCSIHCWWGDCSLSLSCGSISQDMTIELLLFICLICTIWRFVFQRHVNCNFIWFAVHQQTPAPLHVFGWLALKRLSWKAFGASTSVTKTNTDAFWVSKSIAGGLLIQVNWNWIKVSIYFTSVVCEISL